MTKGVTVTKEYVDNRVDSLESSKADKSVPSNAGNLAALTADGNLADSGIDTTNGLTVPDGDIQATNGGVYGISYLATGGDINASGNIFTDNSGEIEIRDGEGDVLHSLSSKAARASLAPEYSPTSAYAVGAIVYHDGNIYQCKTAIADGGEAWNAEHWELRKLDDFFTNSNSLLTATIDARLPYPLYPVTDETGLLRDRAINTTSLASVTVPENFTDLLVRATVASSLSVTMPEAITKYGDTFPGEAGEYIITITKTGAAEAYVRTIKLEEVA